MSDSPAKRGPSPRAKLAINEEFLGIKAGKRIESVSQQVAASRDQLIKQLSRPGRIVRGPLD